MAWARFLPVAAGLLLVLLLPPTGATATAGTVSGSATACTGLYTCSYTLNGSSASGTATTGGYGIAFRLPGEANQTIGQYAATVVNRSGTVSHVRGSVFAIDANSGRVILGTTDTFVNATAHCSRSGCYYTYKLVNGTIALRVTRFDGTSTTVACTPSSISAGGSTKCTVAVTDLANRSIAPTGNVSFASSLGGYSAGSFANHARCALVKGSCTLKFSTADDTAGSVSITATFHGTATEFKSAGRTSLWVSGN